MFRLRALLAPSLILLEALAGVWLAVILFQQLVSYGPTEDPDPEGYASFAAYMKDHWAIMVAHWRLPGYPFFLAVVDSIGPGNMHQDAYWAQLGLYLVCVAVLWFFVRRRFGAVVALVFLAILVVRSFLTRHSVFMLADFVSGLAIVVAAFTLFWVMRAPSLRAAGPRLALFGLMSGVTFLIHPSGRIMLALLIGSLGVALLVYRRRAALALTPRLAISLVLLLSVTSAAAWWADNGNGRYNFHAMVQASLLCLPPVADTEIDRRVEEAKTTIATRIGYPPRDANPIQFPEMTFLGDEYPREDVNAVWRSRILGNPLLQVACGARQIRWRWHLMMRQFIPFDPELRLATVYFLPDTGSPRSTIYRTTGIELSHRPDNATWEDLRAPLVTEILRMVLTVGLIVIGTVVLVGRFGAPALAVVLATLLWGFVSGMSLALDARYMVAVVPGIYLAQAIAIVMVVKWLVHLAFAPDSAHGDAPVAATLTREDLLAGS